MIEASYPGKNYNGTKKRFGVFISPFSSAVKKDAESIIDNKTIRNSKKSIIPLKYKYAQMLGVPLKGLNFGEKIFKSTNNYLYKNGTLLKISKYSLYTDQSTGEHFLELEYSKKINNN
jgi:hypothetical protein